MSVHIQRITDCAFIGNEKSPWVSITFSPCVKETRWAQSSLSAGQWRGAEGPGRKLKGSQDGRMHYARLSAFCGFVLFSVSLELPVQMDLFFFFYFLFFATLALVYFLLIIAFFGGLNLGVSCWRQLPIWNFILCGQTSLSLSLSLSLGTRWYKTGAKSGK